MGPWSNTPVYKYYIINFYMALIGQIVNKYSSNVFQHKFWLRSLAPHQEVEVGPRAINF